MIPKILPTNKLFLGYFLLSLTQVLVTSSSLDNIKLANISIVNYLTTKEK